MLYSCIFDCYRRPASCPLSDDAREALCFFVCKLIETKSHFSSQSSTNGDSKIQVPFPKLSSNSQEICLLPASCLSGNAFVSETGGLAFKSWADQLDTMLPTARHRCKVSSKRAVLHRRNDVEIGLTNSLHASTSCSE